MTGSVSSTTNPIAGTYVCVSLTRTGGTAWTGSPFTVSGPLNCVIRSQRLPTNASAKVIVYTGDLAGTVTITDTLNSETYSFTPAITRAVRTFTGTHYFVTGGIAQPAPPHATIDAATGTTAVYYQVIAINSAGKTKGFTAISKTLLNSTQTTWKWGPGITTVNLGPATITGVNTITLNWAAIPGATSYDLIKSTDGTTWVSMTGSLAVAGLTYTDTGATTAAYTLPTVNGTALGSDSNTGLSLGQAFATMSKAVSLAVSGDGIACTGFISDSAKVNIPAGVIVTGPAVLYSTFSGAGDSYFSGSGSEYSDITFRTDIDTQFLFGSSASPDAAVVDVRTHRCSFIGQTNVVRIAFTSYIDFEDAFFYTHHGSFGMVSGATDAVCNLIRSRFFAYQDIGHVNKSDVLPINHNEGFLLLRDCSIFATQDSQNPTDQFCYGIFIGQGGGTPVGIELINCQIVAPNQIVIDPATVALAGIWTRDTVTDPNLSGTITSTDVGAYVAQATSAVTTNDIANIAAAILITPANKIANGASGKVAATFDAGDVTGVYDAAVLAKAPTGGDPISVTQPIPIVVEQP